MDTLDFVLLAICVAFAFSGYRQGFLVGALTFIGFLGGGAIGAKLAPTLHEHAALGINSAVYGVGVLIIGAVLGQLIATTIGIMLRRRLLWQPARTLDAIAGAGVSVVAVLLVAWLIGTAVAHTAASGISRQVRRSQVLAAVDRVMPDDATTWFSSFRRLLDRDGLPEVFGGIGGDRIVPVAPPNPKLARSRVVRAAEPSIVKITGAAVCNRRLEGSGFVYAEGRVMTNAHVVAGVRSPSVRTPDGVDHPARVVVYDPDRDVAVLSVPGLAQSPLRFAGQLPRGRSAIVAGYPEDGPFTPVSARVRTVERARGPNIYQDKQVTRQIYSLYATVRPGNSGGPLLTTGGDVAGVIFAAAVDDAHTGYALTAQEVAPDAAAGRTASRPVSTRGCD